MQRMYNTTPHCFSYLLPPHCQCASSKKLFQKCLLIYISILAWPPSNFKFLKIHDSFPSSLKFHFLGECCWFVGLPQHCTYLLLPHFQNTSTGFAASARRSLQYKNRAASGWGRRGEKFMPGACYGYYRLRHWWLGWRERDRYWWQLLLLEKRTAMPRFWFIILDI